MLKKLVLLALIVCCLSCDKKQQEEPVDCPAQPCTLNFAMIGLQFKDAGGNAVDVKDITAVNQRTKENILPEQQQGPGRQVGYYVIAHDGMRSKLSVSGDDIVVTATIATGNQTKTATLKISGGCSCHVNRISGPQEVKFD